MSLYASYLKERIPEVEIIEEDFGFITYQLDSHECYIKDIYVVPEQRKNHKASSLADRVTAIAKEKGCKILTGTVCPSAKGADASLKILIAYGMSLHSSVNNLIIFKKEIV
jgi:ribosomal protein S18 acetylase RimI-like enzyme